MFQHIFISYASSDGRDFARRLHDDLEIAQFNAWLDIHDIKGGDDWSKAIDKALQSAWVVCVVLTPGAVASIQVQSEWNDALEHHLPVIPLLVKNCTVPRVLKIFNWYDFRERYEPALAGLRQRLQQLPIDHLEYLSQQLSLLPSQTLFESKAETLQNAAKNWSTHFDLEFHTFLPTQSSGTKPKSEVSLSMVDLRRQIVTSKSYFPFDRYDTK